MIIKLNQVDKVEQRQDIINFIKRVSPFSDQNPRLMYVINEFLANNMERPFIVALNEEQTDPFSKIKSTNHFMIWKNGTTLFVGTYFLSDPDIAKGVNVSKYENLATE